MVHAPWCSRQVHKANETTTGEGHIFIEQGKQEEVTMDMHYSVKYFVKVKLTWFSLCMDL